jgi:uncharacterized protein (TIGR02679 family)
MTGAAAQARLERLLGTQDLSALRLRLRRHYERNGSQVPDTSATRLRLANLAPHEHAALTSLLGRRPRSGTSITVDLAVIDEALARAGLAQSLRAALEALDGPIIHLPTARAEAASRWSAVVAATSLHGLAQYLATPVGSGVLKRLARGDPAAANRLCERAERVLLLLPAGGIPRAQLAAETLGDAHALDDGEATAALVLAVLRQRGLSDVPAHVEPAAADTPVDERRRTVWARAGVLVNELARPALVLNLPVRDDDGSYSRAGEPTYLSLSRLVRTPPRLDVDGRRVFICENPNIVAIVADRLGPDAAPLVCTDGMPAAAQRTLLGLLAAANARLLYHGDFDWAGLQIANHVIRTFGAAPWRMGVSDYAAAIAAAAERPVLRGAPVDATWDAALSTAMCHHASLVAEEAVAETLLADLQGL